MDYFVPEKVPQPKNVLESLVWDREKEVDRARERFQVRSSYLYLCGCGVTRISSLLKRFSLIFIKFDRPIINPSSSFFLLSQSLSFLPLPLSLLVFPSLPLSFFLSISLSLSLPLLFSLLLSLRWLELCLKPKHLRENSRREILLLPLNQRIQNLPLFLLSW